MDAERRLQLARAFRSFLPVEDRARHPTYDAICRGVADDDALLELADAVPAPQLPVNVLLAAVHDLLLRGADHVLATRYRSVCERRGLRFAHVDEAQLVREFADFCAAEPAELLPLLTSRAVQTNEVGRSAVLRAALASLGGTTALGLLDAGCSAGLNLFVDAYRVEYGGLAAGPKDGWPVLSCELVGAAVPTALPRIAARVGLDLAPVEVSADDEVAWLLACLWPDDLDRFTRLEAAVELARARRDEVTLLRGDMVDDLARAADAVDAAHLVVLDSWSVPYLPVRRRRDFADAVATIASGRPTSWVAMEFPSVVVDLGSLRELPTLAHPGASIVCVTTFDGPATTRLVAETHPHGRWVDWRSG